MGREDRNHAKNNPWQSPNKPHQGKDDVKLRGMLLFDLIGATATFFAVVQLRRTVDWLYSQLTRLQSSWKGATSSYFQLSFQKETWRRYNRPMTEEYEEEMERAERLRHMQSVYNREKNRYKRSYESWRENDADSYHWHFQRDDWYWKTDTSYRSQSTSYRQPPRDSGSYSLSHHYSVLGLDS